MRNLLARIALTLGGMAVLLGATGIGSQSACHPTNCKAQCPMHEAQRTNPEPPKSCCDKKEEAPDPAICKCKSDSNKSVPAALAAFVKFEVPVADLPRVPNAFVTLVVSVDLAPIELHNHGPPGSAPRSPSIPRAPPSEA